MLRRLRDRLNFTRGLGFRLVALLSVAILPLALISLLQNLSLVGEAERNAELALMGRTASAASGERALLQSALGSADALGPAVLEAMDRSGDCSDLMRKFIESSAIYIHASFVRLNGYSDCHSSFGKDEQPTDLRESAAFRAFMAAPGTQVISIPRGMVTGRSVVLVMQPLYRNSELLGYISLSLTHELLQSTHAMIYATEGAWIVTFNHRGEVLTTDGTEGGLATAILPRDTALLDLLPLNETSFRAAAGSGEERVFTVVTVVPGLVYAVGSWSPNIVGPGLFQMSHFNAIMIPVALWLTSITVAYFAIFRLVLRHISVLRGQMRRFAIGRRSDPPPVLADAPAEIADMSQTFHNMARILIRDEEAMEEAVAEKTVLLKEVHHRVKNNLQLIASIINMQSRMIDDNDAKRVLRSVQDRVAALAAIYRNLYQAEHLDAVEAGRLIGDIISQMTNASVGPGMALRVESQIEPLTLLPDQAVPLSLLATEAFTNALKYAGTPPGEDSVWVRVLLSSPQPGHGLLEIVNSVGVRETDGEGSGLGSQLIEAFATQLECEAFVGQQGDTYVLRLEFAIEKDSPPNGVDPRHVVLTSAARSGAQH